MRFLFDRHGPARQQIELAGVNNAILSAATIADELPTATPILLLAGLTAISGSRSCASGEPRRLGLSNAAHATAAWYSATQCHARESSVYVSRRILLFYGRRLPPDCWARRF